MIRDYQRGGGTIIYESACLPGATGSGGYSWQPPAQPQQLTADDVRAQAQRLIPTAAIGLAPTTTTLVNIDTITWVDTAARRTLPAVQLLGRTVVITLTLHHVAYDFGDGSRDEHGPAGTPYDDTRHRCRTARCEGYYTHVYRATGTKTITATASWTVAYTVDGGAAQTLDGTVPGPAAATTIAVKQARGVLVPND